MVRWWSGWAIDRRTALHASLLTTLVLLAACGGGPRDGVAPVASPAGADRDSRDPLPTPEAAPGTSVTGMPTAPPPPQVPDATAATETPPAATVATATDPIPPADPGAVAVRTDAPAVPAGPVVPAADAAAVTGLLTDYLATIGSGALPKAQAMWSTTPNDSAVLQLARGAAFEYAVGAPSGDPAVRLTVPVDARGRADDGAPRHVLANYTVQRPAEGGTWRIVSAEVRDVPDPPAPPVTLVLDTNAWLDLLVFADPSVNGLDALARDGTLRLAVDARTLAELERVLRYPVLALDENAAAACLERARAIATAVPVPPMRLPRCRDPDDQPFLEVAVAAGASALLTRDDALLRMHRRMQREHGLAIVTPAAWRAAFDQMSKR